MDKKRTLTVTEIRYITGWSRPPILKRAYAIGTKVGLAWQIPVGPIEEELRAELKAAQERLDRLERVVSGEEVVEPGDEE